LSERSNHPEALVPRVRLSHGELLARCVVWAVVIGASLGAVAGFVESIAVYPASSWAAVTLYLALLGALASALLGLLTGSALVLVRRARG
jgi:hypothetical protein